LPPNYSSRGSRVLVTCPKLPSIQSPADCREAHRD
jgi:hypothetical protein